MFCSQASTIFCTFFFFQAEDGIRVGHETGVQTCALPILVHKQQIQQANQGSWGKNKVCKSERKRHPKSVAQIRSKRSTISPLSIAFCTGLEIHCPPNPARAVKYSLGTPSLSLSTFSMNSKGNSDGFTS